MPTGHPAPGTPTVGFSFEVPQRLLHNRDLPGGVVVDVPLGPGPGERRIVSVSLSDASEPAWVYFHPCSSPIDRSTAAANFAEPGRDQNNLTPLGPGECVTLLGDATLTITEPSGPGFATLYPCGQEPPEASNVNYLAGETRPNVATVKVPADGRICFFTSASAHFLADLAGAFTPTSDVGLLGGTPFRSFDTRVDFGAVPFASGEELPLEFRSRTSGRWRGT